MTISLDWRSKYSYGFGHVLNDLCASIWFTYTLFFYRLSYGGDAYMFVVIGQIFDSIITILIGIGFNENRLTKTKLFSLGKYKTWYVIGLSLIVLSFPMGFSEISLFVSRRMAFGIYVLSICISQVSWSFDQISHLSMINEVAITGDDRIWMTSYRQAMSIYAAIMVYVLFWFTLEETDSTCLTKKDIFIFSNNTFFLTAFGLVHSIVFVIGFKEKVLVRKKEQQVQQQQRESMLSKVNALDDKQILIDCPLTKRRSMDSYDLLDWFKDFTFYKITFIYMLARLYLNIHLTYVTLYLQSTLFLPKTSIATVPLLIYTSGFLASFLSNYIESKFSNKHDLFLGIIVGVVASLWTCVGDCNNESFKGIQIYVIAVLFGISTSIVKISTISLVADMIGQNEKSISFVYGTVSFFEKFSGGSIIYILERFNPYKFELPTCLDETSTMFSTPMSARSGSTISSSFIDSSSNESLICHTYGANPVLFYQYIITYGNCLILLLILLGLGSIASVDLSSTQ